MKIGKNLAILCALILQYIDAFPLLLWAYEMTYWETSYLFLFKEVLRLFFSLLVGVMIVL